MRRLKEFFISSMGTFGCVLSMFIPLILALFPAIMLGIPWWITALILPILSFTGILSIPFVLDIWYVVGLFGAINGDGDFFAILYYAIFALVILLDFIPSLITIISAFRKKY